MKSIAFSVLRNLSVLAVISLTACSNPAPGSSRENKTENIDDHFKVTFIELGSVRCIPCQQMQVVMKSIEGKYGDQVKIVFYDVWTEAGKPYADKYGIKLIPTQVFLDQNGQEYFRHEGYFPEQDVVKILNEKGVN